MVDSTESTAITSAVVGWVAPANGKLLSVELMTNAATPGVTTMAAHLDEDTTGTGADSTQDMDTADAAYQFVWTSFTFNKGQKLSISVDPTGAGGTAVWGCAIIELEI